MGPNRKDAGLPDRKCSRGLGARRLRVLSNTQGLRNGHQQQAGDSKGDSAHELTVPVLEREFHKIPCNAKRKGGHTQSLYAARTYLNCKGTILLVTANQFWDRVGDA